VTAAPSLTGIRGQHISDMDTQEMGSVQHPHLGNRLDRWLTLKTHVMPSIEIYLYAGYAPEWKSAADAHSGRGTNLAASPPRSGVVHGVLSHDAFSERPTPRKRGRKKLVIAVTVLLWCLCRADCCSSYLPQAGKSQRNHWTRLA